MIQDTWIEWTEGLIEEGHIRSGNSCISDWKIFFCRNFFENYIELRWKMQ